MVGVVAALAVIGAAVLAGRKGTESVPPPVEVLEARPRKEQELPPVPPGETLAFLRNGDIWLMRADGSERTRLTFFGVSWFCWSPDGRKVALLRGGGDGLWVTEADGSSPRQVAATVERQRGYFAGTRGPVVWTPDSKHLVFMVRHASGDGKVRMVAADGNGERKLADLPKAFLPGPFSTDARFYLYLRSDNIQRDVDPGQWAKEHPGAEVPTDYTSDDSLWLVDLETGQPRKLVEQKGNAWEAADDPQENGFDACFSSDGKYVAHGLGQGFVWSGWREQRNHGIRVMPTGAGEPRLLKDRSRPVECADVAFSPAGAKLVGTYEKGFAVADMTSNKWSYLVTGASPGMLGDMVPGASGGAWSVSPDGTRLAFVVSAGPNYACYIKMMNLDGSNRRTLASLDRVASVQWVALGGMAAILRAEPNAKLRRAAGQGDEGTVRELLAKGADPNGRSSKGIAALHLAAGKGHAGVVKLLLAAGADVDLREQKLGATPLHLAATLGHKEVAEALLASGADVAAREDRGGFTPLHGAAMTGHRQLIELLLAKGAEVNARDKDDTTALHYGAVQGHSDVINVLLAHGAQVNAKSEDGFTALGLAMEAGHSKVADLLRQRGGREE